MTTRDDPSEDGFDEVVKGMAEGTVSRSGVVKAFAAAIVGGLLSVFALPNRADAATLNTLWAVVDADGTIIRSKGANVSKDTNVIAGVYAVFFNRNVNGCVYNVTIRDGNTPGMVSAGSLGGGRRAVEVRTFDTAGGLARRSFNLLVNC